MKLSVSVPDDDLAALDEFVRSRGLPSRSAGVQHAIRLLRFPDLEQDYRAAWEEWETSGDEHVWAAAALDGLTDATR